MWPWWVKTPTEDFTDETLAIGDIYGDDVRGGDGGDGTPYDIRVSLKRQNDFWWLGKLIPTVSICEESKTPIDRL